VPAARVDIMEISKPDDVGDIAHGSWLDLVEGFFSKMALSVLRHIPVASKVEFRQ
jgi:hypothetical protein